MLGRTRRHRVAVRPTRSGRAVSRHRTRRQALLHRLTMAGRVTLRLMRIRADLLDAIRQNPEPEPIDQHSESGCLSAP
ncbi:MAG: malonyl-CoA decarboxylase N-terminal domain-containing protein [Pararhodobacter sp.]